MIDPVQVDTYVGVVLREARLARGLRQADLAALLGVDRSTIARYESGARSMSVGTLLQVAHALNRPALAFLPGFAEHTELAAVLRLLDQRSELLPRVVEALRMSVPDDLADDQGEPVTCGLPLSSLIGQGNTP